MNLKIIITSQLDALGLGKFSNLAAEIEVVLNPAAEKTIRKMVAPTLKKVIRQTVRATKPQQKENTPNETSR